MSPKLTLLGIFFLTLTICCSYIGDDDVVYQVIGRKPTPREGLIRIRWVLLKTFTSIYVGFAIAYSLKRFLVHGYSIELSKNSSVTIAFSCVALAALLIEALQNVIRRLTGRLARPLNDWSVFRRNLGISEG